MFPVATQKDKIHKCGTAMMHLPGPHGSMTPSILPKGPTELDPAATVTNSTNESNQKCCQPLNMAASMKGVPLPPKDQAMWSASHQNQQILSSTNSQIHSTRIMPPDHSPSIDANLILANALSKLQDMHRGTPHRPSNNVVLPPQTQMKSEEEELPLWSPASEINKVQLGTPPQTLPSRTMEAARVPLPLKDKPRGILLGSELNHTSVISNPTSNTCLPLYSPRPASPNIARASVGQHQTSKACQPTLSPLIQKKKSAKRPQMPPTEMYNTTVPSLPKCTSPVPVHTNSNATAISATSMQKICKPSLPVKVKTEMICHASSHVTPHKNPDTDLKNTNRVQSPPSQPLQDEANSDENPENKPKRNKVRWPAIVRDGKVFCPRCFRAFKSTKSLGGHLSKRLRCNPIDEMELNSDLPASFLDLLNSDQTEHSQQNPSLNAHETKQNVSQSSKSHDSIEQTNYRSPTCKAQLDGETSSDTLKQIMTVSNLGDLCVHPQSSQFQKPCVSPGKSSQSGTVLQSVEGGVPAVRSSNPPPYPLPKLPCKRYPTPLLSQALKENSTTAAVRVISKCQNEISLKDQVKVSSTGTPVVHQKSPSSNKAKQPEKRTAEQNIKKKLREQILAGDFQRRNNLSNLANASLNFDSQSPRSCSSESSSKNEDTQMKWEAKSNWPKEEGPAIIPGTVAEVAELLKTHSFTTLRQNSASKQNLQNPTSVGLSDDSDTESGQLSLSQQQWFSDLELAFESLNLIRESSEVIPESVNSDALVSSSSKGTPDDSETLMSKVFFCVSENCPYFTLSSSAFWRHLNKVHQFGFEQINAVKQKYGHHATFQCQRCPRTFTRNPNLKAHYISVHHLSLDEIKELDLKRKQDKAAINRLINTKCVEKQELHQKPIDLGGISAVQSLPSATVHCPALKQTGPGIMAAAGLGTNCPQGTKSSKIFPNGCQSALAQRPQTEVSPHEAKRPLTVDRQTDKPAAMKTSNNILKKTDKKHASSDALSQYKPYRCVHKDCEAAFTIQHNLILHYRTVHQSALSALEVNKEQDQNDVEEELEEEEEEIHISEFRCQVKDCYRIFQEVSHLVQHYLRLHEFSIDKVGDLLSVIRLGRFTCGHEGCTTSFTAFWKYVAHIKELHKDIKLSKPENMYKCEIEGCDHAYATKSNMLRHLMRKHNDYYLQRQPRQEDGAKQNAKTPYQHNKTSDGKENIESNKSSPQKDIDSKRPRKMNNYWTKYEKPVLKSNVEASAMCTKSYPLQYPCMIKGCESVMNSEKSILKHYTVHGLSEKFLEQHRSHYIFCKKFPRQKNGSVRSDDSKSDQSSDSEPELTGHNGTEDMPLDGSRPFLRKRTSPIIPASLLDSLSNDDSSDGSLVIKRKRGRPKRIVEKIVKRKKVSHLPKESEKEEDCSGSSVAPLEDDEQSASLAAFKPMGFEMSFLKFLEQSNKTQPSISCEIPLIGPWVRLSQLNTKETCVKFSNRQNLKSLDKVKIIVDQAFVGVTELMLKQLQDMQPMVLLEKQ